jgi:hypothetical protein
MRSRHIAGGCALAATLGFLALPPGTAQAAGTAHTVTARTAVAAVAARKTRPTLTISTRASTFAYARRSVMTITLGRTRANRTVLIYAAPVGHKRWLWGGGRVNSAGKLRKAFGLRRTTTFTVVYRGDARDAPAMASLTLQAVAGVADGLSGYDKKTKVGGITYYVFRGGHTMVLHAMVWPNKYGECLTPETQQWDAGIGWDDDTTYNCDTLDGGSHDSAPFNLAQAIGDRYRIRADYRRGARDLANLSANGPWLYLVVVK